MLRIWNSRSSSWPDPWLEKRERHLARSRRRRKNSNRLRTFCSSSLACSSSSFRITTKPGKRALHQRTVPVSVLSWLSPALSLPHDDMTHVVVMRWFVCLLPWALQCTRTRSEERLVMQPAASRKQQRQHIEKIFFRPSVESERDLPRFAACSAPRGARCLPTLSNCMLGGARAGG